MILHLKLIIIKVIIQDKENITKINGMVLALGFSFSAVYLPRSSRGQILDDDPVVGLGSWPRPPPWWRPSAEPSAPPVPVSAWGLGQLHPDPPALEVLPVKVLDRVIGIPAHQNHHRSH